MPATQTATLPVHSSTRVVTVASSDADGLLSNREFHAAGDAGYWWLRDLTSGEFVALRTEGGYRFRGDRRFEVDIELVEGHTYQLGAGRWVEGGGRRGQFEVIVTSLGHE